MFGGGTLGRQWSREEEGFYRGTQRDETSEQAMAQFGAIFGRKKERTRCSVVRPIRPLEARKAKFERRKTEAESRWKALEAVQAKLPNLPAVHYHLGMSYAATGQSDKAADQFKKALDLEPDGTSLKGNIRAAIKRSCLDKSAASCG